MRLFVPVGLLLGLLFLGFSGKPGLSQEAPPNLDAEEDAPGTIYGRLNPEKIPDVVAYLMLFRTLADRPDGLSYEQRAGFLDSTGLSDEARRAVIPAANQFEAESDALDKEATGT